MHAKNIEDIAKKTTEVINELIDVSPEEYLIKNIVKNPATMKHMVEQIIAVIDAYFSLRLGENEFHDLILNYASKHSKTVR